MPYIYKNFAMQIFQHPDRLTMIYEQDHEVRQIRMNASHPDHVTPSWYGNSVGHYEGDTLVIDTIGTRTNRPFAMIDLYGTPYTPALHVVERYRLVPYEEAKDGIDRDAKENRRPGQGIDRNYRGKYLQLEFTVEDPGVFTTPWRETVTYGRGSDEWPETACAENRHEYYQQQGIRSADGDKGRFLKSEPNPVSEDGEAVRAHPLTLGSARSHVRFLFPLPLPPNLRDWPAGRGGRGRGWEG